MVESWQIGVFYGFLVSCISGASKLTIRKSWLLQERDPLLKRRAKLMRWTGVAGMSVLNPIFNLLAMSYASPSLLSGFSGLALAWIVLFSGLATGERPSRAQVGGSVIIVAGQVLLMSFGDHASDELVTVQDIQGAYSSPLLQAYFGGTAVWLLTLAFWIHHPDAPDVYQRIAWGMASGSITGLECFIKDALTLLKRLFLATDDDMRRLRPQMSHVLWMVALFALAIATAFSGLMVLTASMKRYDATFANAMHSGSFVASVSLMSLVRYNTSPARPQLYATGLAIILLGVSILVSNSSSSPAGIQAAEGAVVPSGDDRITPKSELKLEESGLELARNTTPSTVEDESSSLSDEEAPLVAIALPELRVVPPLRSLPGKPESFMRRRTSSATLSGPFTPEASGSSGSSVLEEAC